MLLCSTTLRLVQRWRSVGLGTLCEALCFSGIILLHIVYYLLCLRKGSIDPGVDGEVYRQLATDYLSSHSILGEKCTILFWTPWYVFIALVGARQTGVFLLQLSTFVITLAGLRISAKRLGMAAPWRIAAVAVYGLYWPTFDYVIFYQYENFLAWGVATVICLLGVGRDDLYLSTRRWLAVGIVVGLSLFAHSRVAGLLVLSAVVLAGLSMQQKKWLWRHQLAFWVPAILPTFLWALRNRILWGKWVLSSTSFGYNFYVGFNPVATGSFMPQPPYPPLDKAAGMAWDFITSHPGRALELVGWKLIRFWEISEPKLFGPMWLLWQEWLLMPLGLVAMFAALAHVIKHLRLRRSFPFRDAKDMVLFNALFLILYFQLFHIIFYVFTPRFRLPVMPAICLLAVWLIHEGWQNQRLRGLTR